jgi:hypothetical protein
MTELTLADLMAIYYWKEKGIPESKILSILNMDYHKYSLSWVPPKLQWASDIVKEQR